MSNSRGVDSRTVRKAINDFKASFNCGMLHMTAPSDAIECMLLLAVGETQDADKELKAACESGDPILMVLAAQESYQRREYAQALGHLKSLERKGLHGAWCAYLRGRILVHEGKFKDALSYFKRLLKMNLEYKTHYTVLAETGTCYLRAGMAKDAKKALDLVIKSGFVSAAIFNNFGIACMQTGEQAEGFDSFKKALDLDPDFEPARVNLQKAESSPDGKRWNSMDCNDPHKPLKLHEAVITLLNLSYGDTGLGGGWLPLGCLSLVSYLQQHGIGVEFMDYQRVHWSRRDDPRYLANLLADCPGFIGISSMFNNLPLVIQAVKIFKRNYPERTVILGGAGPTTVGIEILKAFPEVDLVVHGEGERALLEVCRALQANDLTALQKIDGLSHRIGEQVHHRPPVTFSEDLSWLPEPAYNRINFSDYDHIGIATARGCPFRCAFCEVPACGGTRVRIKPLQATVNEIRKLSETYGVREFHFYDDVFTASRSRVNELCAEIKKLDTRLNWTCFSRVEAIKDGILEELKKAGCRQIFFGVESGSNRVLSATGKRITVEAARKTIWNTLGTDMSCIVSFIWGYPYETIYDFLRTMLEAKLWASLGADASFYPLWPGPNTEIYKKYKDRLVFIEDMLSHLPGKRKCTPETLALIKKHPEVFTHFYSYASEDMLEKMRIAANLRAYNDFSKNAWNGQEIE